MSFKIAIHPGFDNANNPYISLFYNSLEHYGVEVVEEFKLDFSWFIRVGAKIDGFHFHWPEYVWRSSCSFRETKILKYLESKIPGLWRINNYVEMSIFSASLKEIWMFLLKLKNVFVFICVIASAKCRGIKLVWTVHNVECHEGNDFLDKIGYFCLGKTIDLAIFHSDTALREYVKNNAISGMAVVMQHGNYDGVYRVSRSRDDVLLGLGLQNDLPVVSCLGMMRDYKGLDIAVEVIELFNGNVQFICAGWPHPDFDVEYIRSKLEHLPNVHFMPRFLSDEDFANYVIASDIVLLSYKKVTGSGALLAALTLGCGVVASDLPYFVEVLAPYPNAGRLVNSNDKYGYLSAIEDFLKLPVESRRQAALSVAAMYSWDKVVVPVGGIFAGWAKLSD